ncbi:MAG TPA: hypothetical protein VE093_16430 [Polyangiaceae bacterium]|jgi:hypothetical protein|nr:hypothetical protein [Polyangiaceae bacterium]
MKVFAVLFVASLSFGLLGCPEEPKADPSKASVKGAAPTSSAAPAAAPAKKTEDQGSGW